MGNNQQSNDFIIKDHNQLTFEIINLMIDKEEVRANRLKIKESMKGLLAGTLLQKKEAKQVNQKKNKRKRKCSDTIRMMDQVNYMKEVFISKEFTSLYNIIGEIGQGSESIVYKCIKIKTDEVYAVKIMKSVEEERIRTLKEQYRILKTLRHKNIVEAYNLYIDQSTKQNHLVCEYVQGGTLQEYMQTHKHIKEQVAAQIISQILIAIEYMHSFNACHRDLKPQNIIYNSMSGQLKLIDFEIAKMAKYQHQPLQMCTQTGTLSYKAPEMFSGLYTKQIDIWAIGVIMYQMLYNKLPFESEYTSDLIQSIKNEEPIFYEDITTPMCTQFMRKLLTKNPNKRPDAQQTLHTPFLLKYGSKSAKSSSPLRKSGSMIEEYGQGPIIADYPCCLDDNNTINGANSFSVDIGIRFLN